MIAPDVCFYVFLLILVVVNIINSHSAGYVIKQIAKFYEKTLVMFLVWNAQRKLKKLGKQSWANAIKTSDTDEWMK